jgi:hypothetical protein
MQLVSTKNQKNRVGKISLGSFILLWSVTTLAAFICSLFIIEVGEKPDVGVLEVAVGALAIAIPQSFLLRHHLLPLSWIISTILGWVIITAVGIGAMGWFVLSTDFLSFRFLFGIITGGIGGFVIGMIQWWLALSPSVCWGWLWMFLSSVNWAIAISIGSVVGIVLRNSTRLFLGDVVGLFVTWLVVSILTAISVYKLLKSQ